MGRRGFIEKYCNEVADSDLITVTQSGGTEDLLAIEPGARATPEVFNDVATGTARDLSVFAGDARGRDYDTTTGVASDHDAISQWDQRPLVRAFEDMKRRHAFTSSFGTVRMRYAAKTR
jgi:hypothetical protein